MGVAEVLWCKDFGGKWVSSEILGETKQSYLARRHGKEVKVKKSDLSQNNGVYGYVQWYRAEEKDRRDWVSSNRHDIVRMVSRCEDVEVLKKIMELFV